MRGSKSVKTTTKNVQDIQDSSHKYITCDALQIKTVTQKNTVIRLKKKKKQI